MAGIDSAYVVGAADALRVRPQQGLALPVLAGAAERQEGWRYARCPADFAAAPSPQQQPSAFAMRSATAQPSAHQKGPSERPGEQLQQQSSPEDQQISQAPQRQPSGQRSDEGSAGCGDDDGGVTIVVAQRRPLLYFQLDGHNQPCGPVSLDALSSASQTVR